MELTLPHCPLVDVGGVGVGEARSGVLAAEGKAAAAAQLGDKIVPINFRYFQLPPASWNASASIPTILESTLSDTSQHADHQACQRCTCSAAAT